ncbi:hypothetical protein E2C01_044348 [Portunus trituberculatus]|uniref:Uncharacterized protein n=1 Tax=Portunus trituberculatus TaxID=210409 RepID=A0A5B7FZ29_PORTR|nr:hypothetical protein [Portunus trituberculatus]
MNRGLWVAAYKVFMVSIELIPPITRCHSRGITLSFFRFLGCAPPPYRLA